MGWISDDPNIYRGEDRGISRSFSGPRRSPIVPSMLLVAKLPHRQDDAAAKVEAALLGNAERRQMRHRNFV